MKVGIITITKGQNYGNRLQNYAVQHIIENLGFEVETLNNDVRMPSSLDKLKYFIKQCLVGSKYWKRIRREISFAKFNEKYINYSNLYISNEYIPSGIEKFDYFVCGSDQIWNPMFEENGKINFLDFVPESKRIAFAPSFGTSFIPENRKEEFKKYLEGIPHLSVREEAGFNIIKELTGREAEVLLDPTLSLTKQEWDIISEPTEIKPKNKYLLTYMLGEMTAEYKNKIKKIAQQRNLEILNLNDPTNYKVNAVNPSQFIYLISNAELVCTDSFHGTVFSIIYEIPFLIFERVDSYTSMNSRFTNLLSKLNLESRYNNKVNESEIFDIDYTNVRKILNREKEKTLGFLKKAFNLPQ